MLGLTMQNFLVIAKQSKIKRGVLINSDLGRIEEICWKLDAMMLFGKTFLSPYNILRLLDKISIIPHCINPRWWASLFTAVWPESIVARIWTQENYEEGETISCNKQIWTEWNLFPVSEQIQIKTAVVFICHCLCLLLCINYASSVFRSD